MAKSKKNTKGNSTYQGGPLVLQHISDSVNPFSKGALGKKIHDKQSANTFTLQARQKVIISTNTNGMAYHEFRPTLAGCNYGPLSTTASFLPTTGTLTGATYIVDTLPTYSSIVANVHRYRTVSFGIRISCMDAALSAKGQLMIKTLDQSLCVDGKNVLTYNDDTTVVPITHDMDIFVVPPHTEGYGKFLEVSSSYQNIDDDPALINAFRQVGLTLSGCPTTNQPYLAVEWIVNIECEPIVEQITAQLATPPYPEHPIMQSAISNTRSILPSVHSGAKSLWTKVKEAGKQALLVAGEALLGRAGSRLMSMIAPTRLMLTNEPLEVN